MKTTASETEHIQYNMNNPLIQRHPGSASRLAVCALSSRDKWQKSFYSPF